MSNYPVLPEEAPVVRKLHLLRRPAPRNPQRAAQTRARFYASLDEAFPDFHGAPAGWLRRTSQALRVALAVVGTKLRLSFPSLVTGLATLVFLVSAAGLTAQAAAGALPGEPLYGMRTRLEQTRLSLALTPNSRGDLYLKLAANRLQDIDRLLSANRLEHLPELVRDVERFLQQSQLAAQQLAATDAQAAHNLQAGIDQTQAQFASLMAVVGGGPALETGASPAAGGAPHGQTPEAGAGARNRNEGANSNANANGNRLLDGTATPPVTPAPDGNTNDGSYIEAGNENDTAREDEPRDKLEQHNDNEGDDHDGGSEVEQED